MKEKNIPYKWKSWCFIMHFKFRKTYVKKLSEQIGNIDYNIYMWCNVSLKRNWKEQNWNIYSSLKYQIKSFFNRLKIDILVQRTNIISICDVIFYH